MAAVSSRVTIYDNVVKQLKKAAQKALEETGEALHTEVVQAQVVPRDTGTLQNEAFFCDYSKSAEGTVSLVHSTPYARRLYFHPEYHFHKEANPNAKGKWFADWLPGGSNEDFCEKTFAELYRKEAGT